MKGLTVLALFTATICSGQVTTLSDKDLNSSGAQRLLFTEYTIRAIELARFDIDNGTPILLLQGGISPIVYGTDRDFEAKYGVYFYDWGCVGPEEYLSVAYNFQTFEFLTKHFGGKWMKKIRNDVIGLSEWRKTKRK